MFRQAARRLLAAGQRGLTTSASALEETSVASGPKEFAAWWEKMAPSTMDVPKFPSDFLKATAGGESLAQGDLFPVNFYTPHGVLASMAQVRGGGWPKLWRLCSACPMPHGLLAVRIAYFRRRLCIAVCELRTMVTHAQKDGVILPGVDGYFGLKANHVPVISQLQPGVVELHNGAEMEKFFISGGFAFVHPNGVADICVLEAATLDTVDPAAVKSALATAQSAQGQGDEEEQAAARAAVELLSALDSALDNKA